VVRKQDLERNIALEYSYSLIAIRIRRNGAIKNQKRYFVIRLLIENTKITGKKFISKAITKTAKARLKLAICKNLPDLFSE